MTYFNNSMTIENHVYTATSSLPVLVIIMNGSNLWTALESHAPEPDVDKQFLPAIHEQLPAPADDIH